MSGTPRCVAVVRRELPVSAEDAGRLTKLNTIADSDTTKDKK